MLIVNMYDDLNFLAFLLVINEKLITASVKENLREGGFLARDKSFYSIVLVWLFYEIFM